MNIVEGMRPCQVCKTQYFRWGRKATSCAVGVGLGIITLLDFLSLLSAMSWSCSTSKPQQWQHLKNRRKKIGLSAVRFADVEFMRKTESVFTILKPILIGRLGGGVRCLEG